MTGVTNYALNGLTNASNTDVGASPAAIADGQAPSVWSSASNAQWVQVDLGSATVIDTVNLYWGAAFAKGFSLQLSNDNANYNSVYSTNLGSGGLNTITFTPVAAQYVRVLCTQPATALGYSLFEMEVYNSNESALPPPPPGSTPPSISTPPATVSAGTLLTDHIFAATSFWYTPIPNVVTLHANSAAYTSEFLRQKSAYFSGVFFNTTSYSCPYFFASASQATVVVSEWDCQSKGFSTPALGAQWTAVPIPSIATAAAGSDHEMLVYQSTKDTLWEFWQASHTATWAACWGGRMQNCSTSNGIWPNPFGTTATGLPFMGGQVTAEELSRGEIKHVIGFALVNLANSGTFSYPATRSDGSNFDNVANPIPEGARFRLDPSINVANLNIHPHAKTVARALQIYGGVIWDKAGSITFRMEGSSSYTQLGATDPYGASADPYDTAHLFTGTTQGWNVFNNAAFPWGSLQWMPFNYGKP